MRLAIPLFESEVAPRFSYAQDLLLVDLNDDGSWQGKKHPLIQHSCASRLRQLAEWGVHTLLCGGIDRQYLPLAESLNIEVIWGLCGEATALIEAFRAKRLTLNTEAPADDGIRIIAFSVKDKRGLESELAGRFDENPYFVFLEEQSGCIRTCQVIPNLLAGEEEPEKLAKFIHERKGTVLIAADACARSIDSLQSYGIEVLIGGAGNVQELFRAYLSGELICEHSCAHPAGSDGGDQVLRNGTSKSS